MRDSIAVLIFITIILFILVTYVVSALFFDGLINMLEMIYELILQLWDIIKLVGESIQETYF